MFNAMALIHYEEMIERGRLPAELNDMPSYQPVVKTRKSRKPAKKPAERSEEEPWLIRLSIPAWSTSTAA